MNEQKLEPCSCGGEAKVIKDVLGFWAVECKSCLTRLGVSDTKEEIIEAWNDMRRKEMSEEKLPHWIEENKRPKSYMWVCSECGSTAYDMPMCSKKRYVKICSLAYCPHCGAKMVGEQEVRSRTMKNRTWKKVTPIPPEYNGHGYEFYCTKCGYGTAYLGKEKYPPYECHNCGNGKVREKE